MLILELASHGAHAQSTFQKHLILGSVSPLWKTTEDTVMYGVYGFGQPNTLCVTSHTHTRTSTHTHTHTHTHTQTRFSVPEGAGGSPVPVGPPRKGGKGRKATLCACNANRAAPSAGPVLLLHDKAAAASWAASSNAGGCRQCVFVCLCVCVCVCE